MGWMGKILCISALNTIQPQTGQNLCHKSHMFSFKKRNLSSWVNPRKDPNLKFGELQFLAWNKIYEQFLSSDCGWDLPLATLCMAVVLLNFVEVRPICKVEDCKEKEDHAAWYRLGFLIENLAVKWPWRWGLYNLCVLFVLSWSRLCLFPPGELNFHEVLDLVLLRMKINMFPPNLTYISCEFAHIAWSMSVLSFS